MCKYDNLRGNCDYYEILFLNTKDVPDLSSIQPITQNLCYLLDSGFLPNPLSLISQPLLMSFRIKQFVTAGLIISPFYLLVYPFEIKKLDLQ